MNQYYYVPLMNGDVKCDGVSLKEHLEVVAPEIYSKECQYLEMKDLFSESNNSSMEKRLQQMNRELDEFYRKKKVPRRMVLVSSEYGIRELGSDKVVDSMPLELLVPYQVSPDGVIDIYVDNLDYSIWSIDFFEYYDEKKDSVCEKKRESFAQKVRKKFPFISRKTHN